MAETIPVKTEDNRLELISEQLINFANADFSNELEISEKRDNIDSIIVGLNLLGEELKSHIDQVKEHEVKLKEAFYRLNEAQRLAHIGSWEWDILQNKIEWTDELYRLYGVESDSFDSTFENYLKFIHPEDREFVNKVIQTAYQDHKPFDFFHRIIGSDGVTKIHHSRGQVFVNTDGQPVRMNGTAQDVTQIKEAENKNHLLAAIVEHSSDAIISKTLTGHINSWNKKAEEIFGYKESEIIGKHITILFPEDRINEEADIMKTILSGESLSNFETERKKKDGSVFSVSTTISAIFDSQKKVIGISTIARDITEKKIAENKLQKYTQELEYKNKETQQFSYIASHDLQEPLRTITNYINLLSKDYKGKLEGNADLYIKFISNGAQRMKTLIFDLLEFTRIDNDKKLEEIDCNTLLKEVLDSMNLRIDENKALIKLSPLPVITGHKTRITSLFQNLISNAIKFRKKDIDPIITIAAKDSGSNWLFTIEDNGIGMEEDYFERIFMLFQRLHPRNEYEGTGIGLAHCKKIVELRGGKIWVESILGVGSKFYISLPKKIE